ncbi:MAG: glycosyltransferase family 1 protein, partial [Candidatus Eisenbacteria bacterium]|nr:glycosyltransferase family 1 protein [Candidatus Eisenbacteria bacterium]
MNKRVALISEHASPLAILGGRDSGGQNVYVAHLARNLTKFGYRVDVFTRRDDPSQPEVLDWERGVRIVHVPAGPPEYVRKEDLLPYMEPFTACMLAFFRRRRIKYDLIHANFWMSALVAADLKKALGIPFVVTFHALGRVRRRHQGAADEFPDQRFEIEDRVIAEADMIIAECPQDEEDLIHLYNAEPSRLRIIPCGFDPAEFAPIGKARARRKLGIDPGQRVLLQLGRMVPRKGVDNVVRGFGDLVHEHGIDARLFVVGGETDLPDPKKTPEIGRLQEIARVCDVAGRVVFTGRKRRASLRWYYAAADLFLTTPWYEPFGITPVEAMACGTPVIGSSVGGIKFSVRDSETGYLVPPNDPAAIAAKIAHLYRNPKLLDLFARQAIARARHLFSWQKVASGVAELYEDVLAAGRPETRRRLELFAMVERSFESTVDVLQQSRRLVRGSLVEAAQSIAGCALSGRTIYIRCVGSGEAVAHQIARELTGGAHMAGLDRLRLRVLRPSRPPVARGGGGVSGAVSRFAGQGKGRLREVTRQTWGAGAAVDDGSGNGHPAGNGHITGNGHTGANADASRVPQAWRPETRRRAPRRRGSNADVLLAVCTGRRLHHL